MIGVDRIALRVTANYHATTLSLALRSIVMRLAQTLQIAGVKEERLITLVRHLVIDNCCRRQTLTILEAHGAERLALQLLQA